MVWQILCRKNMVFWAFYFFISSNPVKKSAWLVQVGSHRKCVIELENTNPPRRQAQAAPGVGANREDQALYPTGLLVNLRDRRVAGAQPAALPLQATWTDKSPSCYPKRSLHRFRERYADRMKFDMALTIHDKWIAARAVNLVAKTSGNNQVSRKENCRHASLMPAPVAGLGP